ncbi:MAG TPA: ATP-binding protein [Kofleriaceae bacterium]|nr:ATP-binding protein [Kofleriaceae bacterium]
MKQAVALRTRLLIAGALLLATTVATGAWSVMSAREVSHVVGHTVADDQRAIDVASTLAGALEREDDALLLALSDPTRGQRELARQREAVTIELARVTTTLGEPEHSELRADIDAYHTVVDELAAGAIRGDAALHYLEAVNPKLRHAIATINRIRDRNFRSSLAIAEWSRDRSTSSMRIVALISVIGFLLLVGIAIHFARVVVQPLRAMSRAVEAIRRNDFSRRVAIGRDDELGQLGEALDLMSDELAEFRRANIAEVIRAKDTLEATLAALPDAVVVIAPDRTISSANPRAAALLGAAIEGRALDSLAVPPATRDAVGDVLAGTRASLEDVDLGTAIELGATTRKLLPRVVPIARLAGQARGAVLVLSDVTELVQLDQMRLELVAVASHELRTPLTTLRMTVLMLQERAAMLGERERALIDTAMLGIQQLSVLVDEFLSLTQIEAGQLRLTMAPIAPAELIERAVREVASAADEAGVTIEVARTGELPAIAGDPSRLAIVLGNLLGNAIRYTPRGGQITVAARATGDRLIASVTDTGPGVPPEHRERVFERFFRVEHTRAARGDDTPHAGVGIGLYIARQIVVAHGGTIRCDAGPDGGARFTIELPIA